MENKHYNSRDEFINDDNLTDEEKAEIMQSILDYEEYINSVLDDFIEENIKEEPQNEM